MVTDTLYEPWRDEKYLAFSRSLSPTDTLERKGIRIPVLRKLALSVSPDDIEIKYHEDVILKGLAIGKGKEEAEEKLEKLTSLLPFLSSWDQCDTIVTSFRPEDGEKELYKKYFSSLLKKEETFTKRLGIVWLLDNRKILDREEVADAVIKADDEDEYYVSMAVAWALSLLIIDDRTILERLDEVSERTGKRTMQKLRDSYRFNPRHLRHQQSS